MKNLGATDATQAAVDDYSSESMLTRLENWSATLTAKHLALILPAVVVWWIFTKKAKGLYD